STDILSSPNAWMPSTAQKVLCSTLALKLCTLIRTTQWTTVKSLMTPVLKKQLQSRSMMREKKEQRRRKRWLLTSKIEMSHPLMQSIAAVDTTVGREEFQIEKLVFATFCAP